MAFPVTTIPPSSSGGGSSDFGDITGWPGASTDFVRGDGSDGPLSAADMPTGIDAAKLADGSVSNAELQTLSDISTGSTIQTQINGKAATPTGTPNGSKYLRDDNSWQAVSATDSTKLPLAGGTGSPMTGPLVMTNTTAPAGSENYICAVSGYAVVNGSAGRLRAVGANILTWDPGGVTVNAGILATPGLTSTAAVQLTGTQTSAGAGTTCLYRGSSGEFIANCGGGGWFSINVNNNQQHVFDAISGYQLPTAQSGLSSTNYGLWRDAQSTCIQSGGGCMVNSAKLVSRANSTAYALCPAPTGDVIRCLLQDSSSKRAVALLDASGTITFEAGSHADYVASSSPASGEVGVYIVNPGASGSLTIKPGSAGARSIAANVARARA